MIDNFTRLSMWMFGSVWLKLKSDSFSAIGHVYYYKWINKSCSVLNTGSAQIKVSYNGWPS